jgi:two-component system sensor histidine kinase CreC
MHVAAPIFWQGELIGVLSLAKPMASVTPYAERAAARVRHSGLWLLAATAAIGLIFSAWLTWSITRLQRYARTVAEGGKAEPPTGGGTQFSELARLLARMREKLEGKQYVERYVQNLAHEMKSPLTAVMGAAEILEDELPAADRQRFATSIGEQARRLRDIIDRMLMLARVEQLQAPGENAAVDLEKLLKICVAERELALAERHLTCHVVAAPGPTVPGDAFLLRQAVLNLLDNAIDFSPDGGDIDITLETSGERADIHVRDHGSGAPDYALAQIFDRFYSLPRPATGKKSTGLGLALVREVARLHGGDAEFTKHPQGGAVAGLWIRTNNPRT